jgi:hypothetical protein
LGSKSDELGLLEACSIKLSKWFYFIHEFVGYVAVMKVSTFVVGVDPDPRMGPFKPTEDSDVSGNLPCCVVRIHLRLLFGSDVSLSAQASRDFSAPHQRVGKILAQISSGLHPTSAKRACTLVLEDIADACHAVASAKDPNSLRALRIFLLGLKAISLRACARVFATAVHQEAFPKFSRFVGLVDAFNFVAVPQPEDINGVFSRNPRTDVSVDNTGNSGWVPSSILAALPCLLRTCSFALEDSAAGPHQKGDSPDWQALFATTASRPLSVSLRKDSPAALGGCWDLPASLHASQGSFPSALLPNILHGADRGDGLRTPTTEVVVVLGRPGRGKSFLLRKMLAVASPANNIDVTGVSLGDILRSGVGESEARLVSLLGLGGGNDEGLPVAFVGSEDPRASSERQLFLFDHDSHLILGSSKLAKGDSNGLDETAKVSGGLRAILKRFFNGEKRSTRRDVMVIVSALHLSELDYDFFFEGPSKDGRLSLIYVRLIA